MEFNCLGLRGLHGTGLLPIRKAFVKFDLNSLKALEPKEEEEEEEAEGEEDKKESSNITTQPNESGANPNINAVLTIDTHLPKDNIYWPWLSCTVYDHCMWGFAQPTLGTFNLPLTEVLIPKIDKAAEEEYLNRKTQ